MIKKLYTNYLQVDKIGIRTPSDHPGDKEYHQLCIDQPSYELMPVYLSEHIEKLIEEFKQKVIATTEGNYKTQITMMFEELEKEVKGEKESTTHD